MLGINKDFSRATLGLIPFATADWLQRGLLRIASFRQNDPIWHFPRTFHFYV